MHARYYDPYLNRFVSPDTIVPDASNPQGLNRFTYVLNNPLRYTDPTGHFEDDEILEMLINGGLGQSQAEQLLYRWQTHEDYRDWYSLLGNAQWGDWVDSVNGCGLSDDIERIVGRFGRNSDGELTFYYERHRSWGNGGLSQSPEGTAWDVWTGTRTSTRLDRYFDKGMNVLHLRPVAVSGYGVELRTSPDLPGTGVFRDEEDRFVVPSSQAGEGLFGMFLVGVGTASVGAGILAQFNLSPDPVSISARAAGVAAIGTGMVSIVTGTGMVQNSEEVSLARALAVQYE